MPRSISFAWTTPALLAGRKTCTRRDWPAGYAAGFKAGDEVLAFDRSPRNGGKPIARLRLTQHVRHEPDADAPDSDWEAEGFAWFWEREQAKADGEDPGSVPASAIADRVSWEGFCRWRRGGGSSWVVRFQVLEFLTKPKPAAPADPTAPTPAQLEYVANIQRRLHLPDALLDNHAVATFGKPFAALDRRQVSSLLDAMIGWEQLPAELARAKGQVDLPGFGP